MSILSRSIHGFPCGSVGKESTGNVGDLSLIPGLGRSPGDGTATHSCVLAWRTPWTPWGCKELDVTERLSFTHSCHIKCVI